MINAHPHKRYYLEEIPFNKKDYVECTIENDYDRVKSLFLEHNIHFSYPKESTIVLSYNDGFIALVRGSMRGYYTRYTVIPEKSRKFGAAEKLNRSVLRWMFTKTDAVQIKAYFGDNLGSYNMSKNAPGAIIFKAKKTAVYGLVAWAEEYGPNRAIEEMKQNGLDGKANFLSNIFHDLQKG